MPSLVNDLTHFCPVPSSERSRDAEVVPWTKDLHLLRIWGRAGTRDRDGVGIEYPLGRGKRQVAPQLLLARRPHTRRGGGCIRLRDETAYGLGNYPAARAIQFGSQPIRSGQVGRW